MIITAAYAYDRANRQFCARAYATVNGAKCARVIAFGDTGTEAMDCAIDYVKAQFDDAPSLIERTGRTSRVLLDAHQF